MAIYRQQQREAGKTNGGFSGLFVFSRSNSGKGEVFHAGQQALPGLPLVAGAHRVRPPGDNGLLPLPGGRPEKVRSV
jgi:hypothetical protein